MRTRFVSRIRILILALALPLATQAARVVPDVQPPQRRQPSVALAERLAQRSPSSALPSDLNSPFNPPDFERNEAAEALAAAQRNAAATPNTPAPPPVPVGDRQILEALATQLTSTGMIEIGGAPRLVMGSRSFEVGTRFTVTYNNEDYELELVTVNRTNFTLRYRGEEIIRPIKSVR